MQNVVPILDKLKIQYVFIKLIRGILKKNLEYEHFAWNMNIWILCN